MAWHKSSQYSHRSPWLPQDRVCLRLRLLSVDTEKSKDCLGDAKIAAAKERDEMLAFTHFRPADVIIVDGTAAQRAKQFASGAKVFLMAFDCFSTNWEMLRSFFSCVMIDEWHMGFGHNDYPRTQRLYDAMEKFVLQPGC